MPPPLLVAQTVYAELLERCAATAFNEAFAENGAFISKTVKGRRYWYFQSPSEEGRIQRYVGPETPELLQRIDHHKAIRDDDRERRTLVSTLLRSFGLPRPLPEIGNVVAALAKGGIFRLRGVLIGTVAYQSYSSMLGIKLPNRTLQTSDVDIAQFKNVSVATEDRTAPMLDILREVDKTFRAVPHVSDGRRVVTYQAKGGLRVDFMTPNEGPETDTPQPLPAFQTDAQPLRFLDFLIHEPEPAVILHGAGIYLLVPAPQRYAVHKLIISRRRREGTAKRDKDLYQAEALLDMLARKRPFELRSAWNEAVERGPTWRKLAFEGIGQIASQIRDLTLRVVDGRREMIPGLDIVFSDAPPRYDFRRDVVTFAGQGPGGQIRCAISRAALDDHFEADRLDQAGHVKKFVENRSAIENLTRIKYLSWPVEEPNSVLIKTSDITELWKVRPKAPRNPDAP